jgi:hypothetical protein
MQLLKLAVPGGAEGRLLTGPGLTNMEYAHLAGEMGASLWWGPTSKPKTLNPKS